MKILLRNLLWTSPATLGYAVAIPLAALWLDRRQGWTLPLPVGAAVLAWLMMAAGLAIALWSVGALAWLGRGTPNPLAPPARLVAVGPYRYSRNPMMLGGWIAGLGLALALASPSLLAAYAGIIGAGALYVPLIEEPKLKTRFGASYTEYASATPRWVRMCHGLSHHV